jgi:glucokinase
VADHVLAHPRSALGDPIAEIARAAQVSQPTVIRFCRSLGCEGLSDFKLRLASGLTGTVPVSHTQVTGDDSMLELGAKVLGNTASAILQVRDQLNRDMIDRAIELLLGRAASSSSPSATTAWWRSTRSSSSCASACPATPTPTRACRCWPPTCWGRDVAVVISSSGRIDDLLAVADIARQRGAAVVAITASQSPLARKADVALIVDHVEDVATHVPMVSRILHLLVIDILAVGVAMRLGAAGVAALPKEAAAGLDEGRPEAPRPGAVTSGPGISAAGALARLTSHSR